MAEKLTNTPTDLLRFARILRKTHPDAAKALSACAQTWMRERARLLEAVAEDAERELLMHLHAICVSDAAGKAKAVAGRLVEVLRERLESAR